MSTNGNNGKLNGRLRHTCITLVQGLSRGAWWIVGLAVLVAGLSVYYTVNHLSFRTNRSDLVASNLKLVRQGEKLDQDFGSHDGLVVVVENGHPHSIAFAEALAAELRKYPGQFTDLFYRLDPEQFKQQALFYLEPDQLRQLKEQLLEQRQVMTSLAADPKLTRLFQAANEDLTRTMIGHLFTSFLANGQEEEKLPDLAFLNALLRQLKGQLAGEKAYVSPFNTFFPKELEDLSQQGYFFTENDKYLLFLVTPEEDGYSVSARALKILRQVVARVQADFPGIKAGVTGPLALEADEMNSALGDITIATWLSLLSQLVLLIIFFRSFRRTMVEGLVLVIGLCWTFGLVTLWVGHLNLLSMVFAPLMLGLTIDYGIHWFCRLEEEQAKPGGCYAENLGCTLRRASPAITYAALAAAVSFFPLVFTGFKGLAELGLILTVGVLVMLLVTLVLLPCLVIITERATTPQLENDCNGHPRPFLSIRWRRPGLIVLLGLIVLALGGVSLWHVPFDLNPLHLQNQKTESVEWELKLLKDSRYSTSYGAMTAGNLTELKDKTEALKKLPTVSHVESILSFLPSEVEAKRQITRELTPLVTETDFPKTIRKLSVPSELAKVLGRIRFKLAQVQEGDQQPEDKATQAQVAEANTLLSQIMTLLDPRRNPQVASRLAAFEKRFFQDLHDKWELLRTNLTSSPIRLEELPQNVRERLISPEGTYLIRVFPAQDIWDPKPLAKFVQDLRKVDANVVGDPVLLHVFTLDFRNACLWAAGMALIAITFMLFLLFRSLKITLLALLPLFVGTGLTLNLMWLLHIPFNQANVLFLPLILGEGIEFGIIILVRWKLEESARAITLPASTAKGVLLAALTTTVGFGSLMISGHQGIFSLGLLATVGSLSVLLASLSVLPAVLRLLEKTQASPQWVMETMMDLRRRFFNMIGKEVQ
ncbi:MAG: MMPL family transporter [Thermodesulfobacteriota bacterium]